MKTVIHTRGKLPVRGVPETFREYQKRITDWPLTHESNLPRHQQSSEFWVGLSHEGRLITTEELDRWLRGLVSRSIKTVRFLVGGKKGLDEDVLAECRWIWSLSPLVMNQSIAVLVVTEQLYRCYTLRTGHPYHQ